MAVLLDENNNALLDENFIEITDELGDDEVAIVEQLTLLYVSDYLQTIRVLLQDTFSGRYRYSDDELIDALNMAVAYAISTRFDLSLSMKGVTSFSPSNLGEKVNFDPMYRPGIVYYAAGYALQRNGEEEELLRAKRFMSLLRRQLGYPPSKQLAAIPSITRKGNTPERGRR